MTSLKRLTYHDTCAIKHAANGLPGRTADHEESFSCKRRRVLEGRSPETHTMRAASRAADVHACSRTFSQQVKAAMVLTGATRKEAIGKAILAFEGLLMDVLVSSTAEEQASSATKSDTLPQGQKVRSAKVLPDERFLSRLYDVLKVMAPEQRRQAISEQLSTSQRHRLEEWIRLRSKAASNVSRAISGSLPKGSPVSLVQHGSASAAGYLITRGHGGYRACVHLEHGLVATTRMTFWTVEEAIAALAELVASRVQWRCGVTESFAVPAGSCFFQAFASVAAVRFAAPLRKSLQLALQDWRELRGCHGPALITRGSLKAGYTPEAFKAQWLSACSVWMEMWKRHGRSSSQLRTMLNDKEKVGLSVQQRAAQQWQDMQERLKLRLAALLQSPEALRGLQSERPFGKLRAVQTNNSKH